MSTRNPMNERNTLEGRKTGVTRKSAASAKPVTKAGASVRTAPKKPAKKGFLSSLTSPSTPAEKAEAKEERKEERSEARSDRKTERARRRAIQSFVPDTAEFKALNRKRIIYSAIGFVGMIIAILVSLFMPDQMVLSIGLMIVAWMFFFIGVRIDSRQLRPLRERGYQQFEQKMARKNKKKKKH